MMYDDLVKWLRETPSIPVDAKLHNEAANAIEELSQIAMHYEEESKGWWVAACEAKEKIEELSKQQWIPVTERLPDEHEFVLVCNDDGEMMIAKMVGCYYKYWVYKYCAYDMDCWDENENGLITHWMPLPELPKGGEKV